MDVLQNSTKEDDITCMLLADITRGRMSVKIKESKYCHIFNELAVVAGILLRRQQAVIPEGLREYVIAGHHNIGTHGQHLP